MPYHMKFISYSLRDLRLVWIYFKEAHQPEEDKVDIVSRLVGKILIAKIIWVDELEHLLHYNDVIMGAIASQLTSLTIFF